MWVSKKKWGEIESRLEMLEDVLFHVERCANVPIMKKTDISSGNWTTSATVQTVLGYSRTGYYESVATMLLVLLLKLGLRAERNSDGVPIITEIPKADGGSTGRAKDGRFSKKG